MTTVNYSKPEVDALLNTERARITKAQADAIAALAGLATVNASLIKVNQQILELQACGTKLENRIIVIENKLGITPVPPPTGNELWHDNIQNATTVEECGFNWLDVQWPINTNLAKPWSDAKGANLSIVPDPLNPARKCLRMMVRLAGSSGRVQFGFIGINNAEFNNQAKAGIYIAYEVLHPAAFIAGGPSSWLSSMDFHAISTGGARNSTTPGLMYHQDGSMRFRNEWGASLNPLSAWSSSGYRIGAWDTVEQFYKYSTAKDVTVRTWLNGALVLEQSGVQTAVAAGSVEHYIKLYGQQWFSGQQGSSGPAIRLVCNVRWGAGRLT